MPSKSNNLLYSATVEYVADQVSIMWSLHPLTVAPFNVECAQVLTVVPEAQDLSVVPLNMGCVTEAQVLWMYHF